MKYYLSCIISFLLFNTNSQVINKTITINPSLSFQNYEHYNRLTLDSPDSHIEFLNDFEFEWGYVYKISVKETKLKETLSDGTQYDYSFDKIISKTKVPDSAQFRLFIDPNRYHYKLDSSEQEMNITLKKLDDNTYLYFDKVEIEVPEHLKDKFNKLILEGSSKLGYFNYLSAKRIKLVGFR